jgi:signal transduction histidine kinase
MPLLDPQPLVTPTVGLAVDDPLEVAVVRARLRRLVAATQAVGDEFALPSLYRRIAETARTLVDAEHVALGVLSAAGAATQLVQLEAEDSSAMTMMADVEELEGLSDLATRLTAGQVSRFASRQLPFALPGLWGDGLLAVPVHYRGQVLAILLLSHVVPGGARPEDEDVLLSLATTAGIAIENARLYEESRRRQEWGREASEISNQLLAATGKSEAHLVITSAVRRLADADLAVWWRPTQDDPAALEVVAACGPGSAELDEHGNFALNTFEPSTSGGLSGTLGTASQEPESRVAEILRAGEIETLLLLPIAGDHGARGWLMCGRRRDKHSFSDLDLDIADTFVAQMGVVLDLVAARSLLERVHLLEDRERIARDLHDHVIQSLFATGLKVKTANSMPTRAVREGRLSEAVDEIDDSIRQLRASIFQLNSAATAPTENFRGAVLKVIRQITPGLGFQPDVSFEGPLDAVISPLLTDEVAAVLREAGTNVGRHARAKRMSVELFTDRATFCLSVIDDGVGIGPTPRRSGLDNLRLRAEILGGDLALEDRAGGGTALRWSVPLTGVVGKIDPSATSGSSNQAELPEIAERGG